MELLLKVEERFQIRGRGLVVVPHFPPDRALPGRFRVEVRRPDGTAVTAEASLEMTHFSGQHVAPEQRWVAALVLHGVTKEDVPIGTEVWRA